jgi:hypothetical protein
LEVAVDEETLTKIHIDLPDHWAVGGEAIWAHPLGEHRFRIDNVPFYAYDLNYGDVVEAIATAADRKPSVVRVLERSGHRTLRIVFEEEVPEGEQLSRLHSLRGLGVSFERCSARYVALDLQPGGDFHAVRECLEGWRTEGIADYETCEARVPGSFDDTPQGDGHTAD